MEKHAVARLIGAPPGYVGYEEGGALTEAVRRRPYQVVLFDEIEKAHPDVFNILLQILEDGHLTDAKGRQIDFTNTIIIMTSNVGADKLQKEASFGFRVRSGDEMKDLDALHAANQEKVRDELKKAMRPEFLNRIDKVIIFRALTKKDIFRIVDLQISELNLRLQKKGVAVQLTPAAKQYLLKHGYDPLNGVRPLRRLIQDTIEDYLSTGLLDDAYPSGSIIRVAAKNGQLVYATAAE